MLFAHTQLLEREWIIVGTLAWSHASFASFEEWIYCSFYMTYISPFNKSEASEDKINQVESVHYMIYELIQYKAKLTSLDIEHLATIY